MARTGLIWAGMAAIVLPFLWMISTSFKMPADLWSANFLWPPHLTWQNYARVWRLLPFARFLLNSLWVGFLVTAFQVLTGLLAGYAFGRLRYPGRDALFTAYLATMMIPDHILLLPTYLMMRKFGMLDTYYALTLPFLAHPFGAFFMRQFFSSLPDDLEHAARIDGCSRLGVLFRVLAPISKPAVAALSVMVFMFSWNDFLWPLIMTNSKAMWTVQVGLSFFQSEVGVEWTTLMAGTTIASVPVLILLFVAQRHVVQSLSSAWFQQ